MADAKYHKDWGNANRDKVAQYNQRAYLRRKKNGQCVNCPNDAEDNRIRCRDCADKRNLAAAAKRAIARKERELAAEAALVELVNSPAPKKLVRARDKKKVAKYNRRHYEKRVSRGQCVVCKSEAMFERVLCRACADARNEAKRAITRARRDRLRELANGVAE